MVRVLLLAAFVLGGCGTPSSKTEAGANADPTLDKCVQKCVQANQMQATSIETIKADCHRGCTAAPRTLQAPATPQ